MNQAGLVDHLFFICASYPLCAKQTVKTSVLWWYTSSTNTHARLHLLFVDKNADIWRCFHSTLLYCAKGGAILCVSERYFQRILCFWDCELNLWNGLSLFVCKTSHLLLYRWTFPSVLKEKTDCDRDEFGEAGHETILDTVMPVRVKSNVKQSFEFIKHNWHLRHQSLILERKSSFFCKWLLMNLLHAHIQS